MSSDPNRSVRVDIVSDVVCPWCAVGYLQLARAAEVSGVALDVRWHPFELNPQMAAEGENLFDHLSAKYGITAQQSAQARAQLQGLGEELGFAFNFTDDMFMWNTFQAHQLIDWAENQGAAHALKLALLKAHFTDRRNVSDAGTLSDIAASVGLDRQAAAKVLSTASHADDVRRKQSFWTSKGVQGVPTMVFEGKYALTGAQGTENYRAILDKLMAEAA